MTNNSTESTWSNCVTAFRSEGDDWLTAFECWAGLSGEQYVSTDTVDEETTTSGGSTIVLTQTYTKVPTSDGNNQKESGRTGSSPEATGSSDSDGGSNTPVGAIVGGVIGGVALIALVAFGFWFMRWYKRRALGAAGTDAAAGAAPHETYPMTQAGPMGYPSTYDGASTYHDHPSQSGSPPLSNSYGYYSPGYPPKDAPPSEMPADNMGRSERAELQ